MTYRNAVPWILFAAVASAGCSSTATSNTASANGGGMAATVASADGQAVEEDPRVCELILPTGSRIAHRVCKKQSEWDVIRGNAQEATIEHQRRAVVQGNPSGN